MNFETIQALLDKKYTTTKRKQRNVNSADKVFDIFPHNEMKRNSFSEKI